MKWKGTQQPVIVAAVIIVSLFFTTFGILTIISENISASNSSVSGQDKAFDPGSMNLSVKPGDDFYDYVNEDWIKSHPVPADKDSYGEFDIFTDETYNRTREIVENAANNTTSPKGSLEQKIGLFYRVGMDNATIDKQRLEPIQGELKLIDNISNRSDILAVSAHMVNLGISPFFSLDAEIDNKNSKAMIATLSQGGLGLPDRDFYLRQDNESNKTRDQYLAHVAKMFVLLGDSNDTAEKNARMVMRMETRLAKASFTNVENEDVVKTYNIMSQEELQTFAPGIDWPYLFNAVGCPDIGKINVRNPSFFKELSFALQNESIEDWKTFLHWNLISATSYYLSSDIVEEQFDFYGRKLRGQEQMKPRWRRVLSAESVAMGQAIGQIYVDKYFDPESKERMLDMISNLKKAFKSRIQNLTWMEPGTKQKALEKLEALDVQVGYPDEWLNTTSSRYCRACMSAAT